MNLIVNGEEKTISEKTDVIKLIKDFGITPENCVCEINGDILPKDKYKNTYLKSDDKVELIKFIGGG